MIRDSFLIADLIERTHMMRGLNFSIVLDSRAVYHIRMWQCGFRPAHIVRVAVQPVRLDSPRNFWTGDAASDFLRRFIENDNFTKLKSSDKLM